MIESTDVRLARIEEGIVHLHAVGHERHNEMKLIIQPLVKQVQDNTFELGLLKRDRVWIVGLAGFLGAISGAMVEILKK